MLASLIDIVTKKDKLCPFNYLELWTFFSYKWWTMSNKLLIIVFVILGASVAVAAAREALLTIEMQGTITS